MEGVSKENFIRAKCGLRLLLKLSKWKSGVTR
jgi:hypothetical protein